MKRPKIVPDIEARANTGDSAVAGTYHTDILTWSEQQAGLLRRVGAGEPINDQVDWDHVVEEIETSGNTRSTKCAAGSCKQCSTC